MKLYEIRISRKKFHTKYNKKQTNYSKICLLQMDGIITMDCSVHHKILHSVCVITILCNY